MMTFSFRPISGSDLASMAAWVSTRVVSWKDAADSHDSVASEALVMPMSSGRADAGAPPSATTRRLLVLEPRTVDQLARQQVGVAVLDDGHLPQHLPDDDLDVLVVDRHTLRAVDLLHAVDEVHLHRAGAQDAQNLLRVDGAHDELLADLDVVAVLDEQARPLRHRVGDLLGAVVGDDDDLAGLVGVLDRDAAGGLGDRGDALRGTGLEQLDHTRQTLRDVVTARHHRCGRYASSAGCRAHRSTGPR